MKIRQWYSFGVLFLVVVGCQKAEETLLSGNGLTPLIKAKDGSLYVPSCVQSLGVENADNCRLDTEASNSDARGFYNDSNSQWFLPYYQYYSQNGYYPYYYLPYYSQQDFCGYWGFAACYNYFGYDTYNNYGSYGNCSHCLYSQDPHSCQLQCYQSPNSSSSVQSVRLNGNLDGDVDVCVNTSGHLYIGQVGSWTGYVSANAAIQAGSQVSTQGISTGNGGQISQQLPGEWSSVFYVYPQLTAYQRQDSSGNPPSVQYFNSGSFRCIRITDGCCGRPGGITFEMDFNVQGYYY